MIALAIAIVVIAAAAVWALVNERRHSASIHQLENRHARRIQLLENRQAQRILNGPVRRSVLVETLDARQIAGVLMDTDEHSMILANVSEYVEEKAIPIDGEVVILRSSVSIVQFP